MLTAFAEQALSAAEREDVIRHLASCADCREVVALSLPPIEAVARPAVNVEMPGRAKASSGRAGFGSRNWFAWPNLGWAGLAAGVAVVASVLLLHPGKQSERVPVAQLEKNIATSPPSLEADAKPAAPSAYGEKQAVDKAAKPDESYERAKAVFDTRAAETRKTLTPAPARDESGAASGATASGTLTSRVLADSPRADTVGDALDKRQAVAVPAAAPPVDTRPVGGAAEQVTVSAEQATVSTEAAPPVATTVVAEDRLMARNETLAPIRKAKAAKEESSPQTQNAESKSQPDLQRGYSTSAEIGPAKRSSKAKDGTAQWNISQGVLRRSLDGGVSWQTALQAQHPLLSYMPRGNDIWAGGQAGGLFHSVDNGATWTQVQPATDAGPLQADIVAIEIRNPAEIVLTTSNRESWTTTDGGKTWNKK